MVVPLREIGNKLFLFSANTNSIVAINLPTVNTSTHIGIDFFNVVRKFPNNYNEVRDYTSTYNVVAIPRHKVQ